MSLDRVDHVAAALNRLPTQFADKERIRALLSAYAGAVQDVEDALQDLLLLRRIDAATGDALTRLGAIVGQPRNGVSDDDLYRRYVRARIAANRSRGTTRDVLRVARAVLADPAFVLRLENLGVAGYQLTVTGAAVDAGSADALDSLLARATSAGVGHNLYTSEDADADVFTLARAAFVKGAALTDDTTLTVYTPTSAFPAAGELAVDVGLATEEFLVYDGWEPVVGGIRFFLETDLTQDHADGAIVYQTDDGGEGFAWGLFANGAQAAGAGTFTVHTDATALPTSGAITIDEGLATEETIAYSSRTSTVFTLVGVTTQNHSDLSIVTGDGGRLSEMRS